MSIFDNLKKTAKDLASQAATAASSKKETFVFAALPESVSDMQKLPEASLDTPFKAAALTVCALCAYAAEPSVGIEMLNFLKGPQPLSEYEKSFLKERFMDNKHVPFSYFEGAKPENDYTPSEPFTVTVESDPYSFKDEGYALLNIRSGGADSARQVKLRKKGDQWFLWEQFLMVGIRTPKSADPWA